MMNKNDNKMKKQKVLIDMTFVSQERPTYSIAIYLFRLLDAIPEGCIGNYILLVSRGSADYVRKLYPKFKIRVWRRNPILTRLLAPFPKWKEKYIEFSFSLMINFGTHTTVLMVSDMDPKTVVNIRKRKVVVVHDLKSVVWNDTPMLNKQCFDFYNTYLHSADRIIAISQYTKNDIIELFGINSERIEVVYNSVVLASSSLRPQKLPNQEYILFVNTLQPYKNAITLLNAFVEIKDKTDKCLVFVGRKTDYWEQTLLPIIAQNELDKRVIHMQDLSEEELKYCYEHASLFVSTSHYEGFGYTPIEAAMCGCPVLCCTCTAIPEVTEGKVNYYEPVDDYHALAEAILKMPLDRNLSLAVYYSEKYSATKQIDNFNKILFS